jgi:prophage antirepressor-like protein
MTQSNVLSFQKNPLEIIKDDDGLWIRSPQIGYALGYKQPRQKMAQLYENNKREFTSLMTKEMKIKTNSGIQNTRVFSLRGVHLIAMFAKTAIAAEFREWVLNVLENHVDGQAQIQNDPVKPVSVVPAENFEEDTQSFTINADKIATLRAIEKDLAWTDKKMQALENLTETEILMQNDPHYAEILADMRKRLTCEIGQKRSSARLRIQLVLTEYPEYRTPAAQPKTIHDFLERSSRHLSRS